MPPRASLITKGDNVKRSRRGGRRPQNGGGGGGGQHNYNPNRTFDSSGPEIKIRGSAANVYEKYLQLARDANTSGDRVMAENYLQHAEHYFRILAAAQVQQQQYQQQNPNNQNNRPQNGNAEQPYPQPSGSEAQFSLTENGNGGETGNEDEEEGEEEAATTE
jgi:hypothetical protein